MNYIYWYIATILKYRNTVINCVSHDSFLQTALLNSLSKKWIYCSISAIQYISSRVQSFSDWKMNKLYQHTADRCKSNAAGHRRRGKNMFGWHQKKNLPPGLQAPLTLELEISSRTLPAPEDSGLYVFLILNQVERREAVR